MITAGITGCLKHKTFTLPINTYKMEFVSDNNGLLYCIDYIKSLRKAKNSQYLVKNL